MREALANALAESQIRELAVYLLGNVPGLPPIAQSIHILGIAVVMGSIVMLDLKLLGLALPTQNVSEMIRRLMPWMWIALVVNASSGMIFVLARPIRYFYNPIATVKFSLLVPAVLLALVVHALDVREPGFWERTPGRRLGARLIAIASLVFWVGVVLAGRWIAYSDYLFFYG